MGSSTVAKSNEMFQCSVSALLDAQYLPAEGWAKSTAARLGHVEVAAKQIGTMNLSTYSFPKRLNYMPVDVRAIFRTLLQ